MKHTGRQPQVRPHRERTYAASGALEDAHEGCVVVHTGSQLAVCQSIPHRRTLKQRQPAHNAMGNVGFQ